MFTKSGLLDTWIRGEHPLSAEAVRKFGPMHILIATKGFDNLFVALANCKRVDDSTLRSSEGCFRCALKMEYLIYILACSIPPPRKWSEVSSCFSHAGHCGSSWIFITVKCLLSVIWPVSRPTKIFSSVLEKSEHSRKAFYLVDIGTFGRNHINFYIKIIIWKTDWVYNSTLHFYRLDGLYTVSQKNCGPELWR